MKIKERAKTWLWIGTVTILLWYVALLTVEELSR